MDRIWSSDVLEEAWKRVRRNRGSAGVDATTFVEIEQHGVGVFLEEIGAELLAGEHRSMPVLRRYIPKSDGKQRPLGIPTVRDRRAEPRAPRLGQLHPYREGRREVPPARHPRVATAPEASREAEGTEPARG
jgi:hypothetical protein